MVSQGDPKLKAEVCEEAEIEVAFDPVDCLSIVYWTFDPVCEEAEVEGAFDPVELRHRQSPSSTPVI